ncbi:MAG TPA: DUF4383 domain-containing protein [Alphaproteobacteria bacterium]|nr:DUF4383 domain-containing protein [Alphaproteobacteria bacterium]
MDKLRNDACVTYLFGAVFILVAILGFIPNPLVGEHGIFVTNAAHNMLHALVGVLMLAAARLGYGKMSLLVFGMVYVLAAILGYALMTNNLFGIIEINMADNYLHLLLGVVIIAAGVYVKPCKAKA